MDRKYKGQLARAYNKAFDLIGKKDCGEPFVIRAPICAYFRSFLSHLEAQCKTKKPRKKSK